MYSLSEAHDLLSSFELVAGLAVPEVETRLCQSLRLGDAGQRALAFYLSDMADRRLFQSLGFSSVAAYAESRLDLDRRRTSELVSAGRKLLELRAIDQAFCEQKIGWTKVRALVRVAVPRHEDAWLALALELSGKDLALEVRLSKPGQAPRKPGDRKGLPEIRFPLGSVNALTHQMLELAKQKFTAELGRPVSQEECIGLMSDLCLSTEEDGTAPGRKRVSASLFRIVVRADGNDQHLAVDTEVGPVPVDGGTSTRTQSTRTQSDCLRCDAGTPDRKTPSKMRREVMERDGHACRSCGSHWTLMVHHIVFRSLGGRTQIWNLITLCARCHGLVHDGLLVLEGEREDQVRFVDSKRRPLREPGRTIEPALSKLSPPRSAPATVTLSALPDVVDGAWWRQHGHLIRFRSGKGLEFRAGRGVSEDLGIPSEQPREPSGDAFAGIVGQDALIRRLVKTAEGRRRRGKAFPHTLFHGPAGTGKTTLARGVASAFGGRLFATSGPLLEDTHALVRLLAGLGEGDALFIDEIHAVPRPVLETLYEAMASSRLDLTLHAGAQARAVRLALPAFTLLAATTEGGDLPSALRSRFGLREGLTFYETPDLAVLAMARAGTEGFTLTSSGAEMLAIAAHGTPRETVRLVERVLDDVSHRYVGRSAVSRALEALGYDRQGLDPDQQRYLGLLRESPVPIPLARLARMLGQSVRTLVRYIEPFLCARGLIRITPRGRSIVSAGLA